MFHVPEPDDELYIIATFLNSSNTYSSPLDKKQEYILSVIYMQIARYHPILLQQIL